MVTSKGKMDQVKGSAKAAAGRATKDRTLEAKGKAQNVRGVVKEAAAKVGKAVSK